MTLLTQVLSQLGVDSTFFYLLGLLFAFYFLFRIFYLKPFQKLIHDRKEATEGQIQEATSLTAKAEEKFAEYQKRFKEINQQAQKIAGSLEAAARTQETSILSAAGNSARQSLSEAYAKIESERKAAVAGLKSEIPALAAEVASKIVGRPL